MILYSRGKIKLYRKIEVFLVFALFMNYVLLIDKGLKDKAIPLSPTLILDRLGENLNSQTYITPFRVLGFMIKLISPTIYAVGNLLSYVSIITVNPYLQAPYNFLGAINRIPNNITTIELILQIILSVPIEIYTQSYRARFGYQNIESLTDINYVKTYILVGLVTLVDTILKDIKLLKIGAFIKDLYYYCTDLFEQLKTSIYYAMEIDSIAQITSGIIKQFITISTNLFKNVTLNYVGKYVYTILIYCLYFVTGIHVNNIADLINLIAYVSDVILDTLTGIVGDLRRLILRIVFRNTLAPVQVVKNVSNLGKNAVISYIDATTTSSTSLVGNIIFSLVVTLIVEVLILYFIKHYSGTIDNLPTESDIKFFNNKIAAYVNQAIFLAKNAGRSSLIPMEIAYTRTEQDKAILNSIISFIREISEKGTILYSGIPNLIDCQKYLILDLLLKPVGLDFRVKVITNDTSKFSRVEKLVVRDLPRTDIAKVGLDPRYHTLSFLTVTLSNTEAFMSRVSHNSEVFVDYFDTATITKSIAGFNAPTPLMYLTSKIKWYSLFSTYYLLTMMNKDYFKDHTDMQEVHNKLLVDLSLVSFNGVLDKAIKQDQYDKIDHTDDSVPNLIIRGYDIYYKYLANTVEQVDDANQTFINSYAERFALPLYMYHYIATLDKIDKLAAVDFIDAIIKNLFGTTISSLLNRKGNTVQHNATKMYKHYNDYCALEFIKSRTNNNVSSNFRTRLLKKLNFSDSVGYSSVSLDYFFQTDVSLDMNGNIARNTLELSTIDNLGLQNCGFYNNRNTQVPRVAGVELDPFLEFTNSQFISIFENFLTNYTNAGGSAALCYESFKACYKYYEKKLAPADKNIFLLTRLFKAMGVDLLLLLEIILEYLLNYILIIAMTAVTRQTTKYDLYTVPFITTEIQLTGQAYKTKPEYPVESARSLLGIPVIVSKDMLCTENAMNTPVPVGINNVLHPAEFFSDKLRTDQRIRGTDLRKSIIQKEVVPNITDKLKRNNIVMLIAKYYCSNSIVVKILESIMLEVVDYQGLIESRYKEGKILNDRNIALDDMFTLDVSSVLKTNRDIYSVCRHIHSAVTGLITVLIVFALDEFYKNAVYRELRIVIYVLSAVLGAFRGGRFMLLYYIFKNYNSSLAVSSSIIYTTLVYCLNLSLLINYADALASVNLNDKRDIELAIDTTKLANSFTLSTIFLLESPEYICSITLKTLLTLIPLAATLPAKLIPIRTFIATNAIPSLVYGISLLSFTDKFLAGLIILGVAYYLSKVILIYLAGLVVATGKPVTTINDAIWYLSIYILKTVYKLITNVIILLLTPFKSNYYVNRFTEVLSLFSLFTLFEYITTELIKLISSNVYYYSEEVYNILDGLIISNLKVVLYRIYEDLFIHSPLSYIIYYLYNASTYEDPNTLYFAVINLKIGYLIKTILKLPYRLLYTMFSRPIKAILKWEKNRTATLLKQIDETPFTVASRIPNYRLNQYIKTLFKPSSHKYAVPYSKTDTDSQDKLVSNIAKKSAEDITKELMNVLYTAPFITPYADYVVLTVLSKVEEKDAKEREKIVLGVIQSLLNNPRYAIYYKELLINLFQSYVSKAFKSTLKKETDSFKQAKVSNMAAERGVRKKMNLKEQELADKLDKLLGITCNNLWLNSTRITKQYEQLIVDLYGTLLYYCPNANYTQFNIGTYSKAGTNYSVIDCKLFSNVVIIATANSNQVLILTSAKKTKYHPRSFFKLDVTNYNLECGGFPNGELNTVLYLYCKDLEQWTELKNMYKENRVGYSGNSTVNYLYKMRSDAAYAYLTCCIRTSSISLLDTLNKLKELTILIQDTQNIFMGKFKNSAVINNYIQKLYDKLESIENYAYEDITKCILSLIELNKVTSIKTLNLQKFSLSYNKTKNKIYEDFIYLDSIFEKLIFYIHKKELLNAILSYFEENNIVYSKLYIYYMYYFYITPQITMVILNSIFYSKGEEIESMTRLFGNSFSEEGFFKKLFLEIENHITHRFDTTVVDKNYDYQTIATGGVFSTPLVDSYAISTISQANLELLTSELKSYVDLYN
jgi:hypothetical protein